MKRILGITGLVIGLTMSMGSAAFADSPTGKKLSAAEIKEKFVGNTTHARNRAMKKFFVFRKEDGTCFGRMDNIGSNKSVSGTWKITEDGQVCASWNSSGWESGCRQVYQNQDGSFGLYNGEGSLTGQIIEVMPGNPEML